MMLHSKLARTITGAIVCTTLLLTLSHSALAAEPHEDPNIATPVFSGISLLTYYSDSLDFVLQKNPSEVEARLEKMPFANIPQSLEESVGEFTSSSISISHLVVKIEKDTNEFSSLLEQSRLNEAVKQAIQISISLVQANNELKLIEQAAETTGEEFKVFAAPSGSGLGSAYSELMKKITRIADMLALYQAILESTGLTIEELLKSTGLTIEELLEITGLTIEKILRTTDIDFEVQPMKAFVGEYLQFEGVLISEGKPLGGREIDILLNSSRLVSIKTDAQGFYEGTVQVPYWYSPELEMQALFYPRGEDVGTYLAYLSPVINIQVLFYQAELEVTAEDAAYPGLETTISGEFSYGQSPPLQNRDIEIYFDDALISQLSVQKMFAQEILIDPETIDGDHRITVSSAATGRYSPVITSVMLNVTQATPIINIEIPKIAMIPGRIKFAGSLSSELGPLSEALIIVGLGRFQVQLESSNDGSFGAEIKAGMDFSVIGSEDLEIQVLPQEPWHATLKTTQRVIAVNWVNSLIIIVILLFLGLYLPDKLKGKLSVYKRERIRETVPATPPTLTVVLTEKMDAETKVRERKKTKGEPRDRIFNWYRMMVRLLQKITQVILGPQQTLREFANENSRAFGPASRYFTELTKVVESLLYSPYRPTKKDTEHSHQLSGKIENETKNLIIEPSVNLDHSTGERAEVQYAPDNPSEGSFIRVFNFFFPVLIIDEPKGIGPSKFNREESEE